MSLDGLIPTKRVDENMVRDFNENRSVAQEFFDELRAAARDCFHNSSDIVSSSIWKLYDYVTSLDISAKDLFIATDPALLLSKIVDKLMLDAQEALCEMPELFYKHQNSGDDVQDRSKSMLYNIADKLGEIASNEAQKLFFKAVNGVGSLLVGEDGFLTNIVKNIGSNFGKVPVASQNACISLVGNCAPQCVHMPEDAQQKFSKGVADMLRATKFPYKFDRDSLREALFKIPDEVMSAELDSALNDFDKKLSDNITP
ncbi:MAG: hypothetical protein LBH49_02550 [Puniceicoccales bacterium]|jgi:hypothetical protein|nr:hypothetical protein [Puniceicoccales bacterium]